MQLLCLVVMDFKLFDGFYSYLIGCTQASRKKCVLWYLEIPTTVCYDDLKVINSRLNHIEVTCPLNKKEIFDFCLNYMFLFMYKRKSFCLTMFN